MDQIGVVGLGIMGKPMAKNLLAKGCSVAIPSSSKAAAELVELGASAMDQKNIGRECAVIFMSLPNGDICKDVLFGENGVASEIRPGTLVVDTSSITPAQAQYCAEKLREKGVGYLDCPVSGGEPGAINGTLAFMAGGSSEDFERAYPYFMMMGTSAILIGDVGSGCITKLANQVIVNLTIAAVSEAMVLATKAGADPEKVYMAIRGGLAGSAVLDAKVPMMLERNFIPGGKISINHKDIKNVIETAHIIDAPVPMSAQLFEIMQVLKVHGHMNDDHSGIVQYFEELADIKVKKRGE